MNAVKFDEGRLMQLLVSPIVSEKATMVAEKAKGGKPKATAVEAWAMACWNQFYTNEAILTADVANWDEAMMIYPDCPHTMKEVMQET